MPSEPILFAVFLIFTGAAVIATLALYARQSMLVAYILIGVILGPWGTGLVPDATVISEIANVGIMFLLFLLGMDLDSHSLTRMLGKSLWVTIISSLVFFAAGYWVALDFSYSTVDAILIGVTMMFSSTILGLKLLPTTILHHKHMGEIIISVLLLQDIIALIVLILMHGGEKGGSALSGIGATLLLLPALWLLSYLVVRFILLPLLARFDTIREYIFLLAIGWCLGMAELAQWSGLSPEIGAFIAGVGLARHPIAQFITESLKPLRDFFLVMFFFTLGAGFDLGAAPSVLVPALVLVAISLAAKPQVFRVLLLGIGEKAKAANEVGYRLGQMSEFSLLIGLLALNSGLLSKHALYLTQLTTILSFVISSFMIVRYFPTPIAVDDKLRRD